MFGRGEPPVDLRVTGAEDLAALGRRLREAGEQGRGLRKELMKAVRTAAGGPMRKATRESWRERMPHKGGLNRKGLRMTVRTNTRGGMSVGVRLTTKSSQGYSTDDIDKGRLRHPIFAREGVKRVWAEQALRPGVITDAQEATAPAVRQEIIRAIESINRKVEG